MIIEKLYLSVLNIPYAEREINHIEDKELRKDFVYELLVRVLFHNEPLKKQLLSIVQKLEKQEANATTLSFCAYVYALNHEWEKSCQNMERVIELEQGLNIDSWMDYGHFLRKILGYQDLSNQLLLSMESTMKTWKEKKYTSVDEKILKEIFYAK